MAVLVVVICLWFVLSFVFCLFSVCAVDYGGTWFPGAGNCVPCGAGAAKPAAGNGPCGK